MAYSIAVRNLGELQRRFVLLLVSSGNSCAEVCRQIGCSQAYGWQLLRLPQIQDAIREEQARALLMCGNLAILRIREILEAAWLAATVQGRRLQLDAARTILDRAGHIAPKAKELDGAGDKPLTELSRDELHARLQLIEGELARQAQDGGELVPVDELDAFFA